MILPPEILDAIRWEKEQRLFPPKPKRRNQVRVMATSARRPQAMSGFLIDAAHNALEQSEVLIARLQADNERLRAALQRIDGINDNPACFNPMIEEVLRRALEPKP